MEELNIQEGEKRKLISLSNIAFEQVLALGLDANHLWMLENPDVEINSPKIIGWKQTLVRKGYLDMQGVLTKEGSSLLVGISSGMMPEVVKRKREKRIEITGDFEKWWTAYPATDTFTYRTKVFKGSRALRMNKLGCQVKFGSIMSKGEYTIEEMIGALELEKKQKMELSLQENRNKMSYFQNSETYLNQQTYAAYIELLKENPKAIEEVVHVTEVKRIDI